MATKKTASSKGRKRARFSLDAPAAHTVSLVGDFNGWDIEKHPMRLSGDGRWDKTVYLLPGTYGYKFYVDGKWIEDPANDQRCDNCHGTRNSLITVV